MIDSKINQGHIETLEDLAERAHATLNRAFDTKDEWDAVVAKVSYSALGMLIGYLLGEQDSENWDRNSEKARLLERYTVPQIIGYGSASEMLIVTPPIKVRSLQSEVIYIEETKEFIKNPNTTPTQIESVARELVQRERYDLVKVLIEYIKQNYEKPSLK